jgi:hypothetical protein
MTLKNLGNLLQSTRQSKNFDLKQVASILKIKEKYLQVLEDGQLSEIEDKVYLCGCIKSYANWLGLNGDELASQFKQSQKRTAPSVFMATSPSAWYRNIFSLTNTKMYVVALVMMLVAYGILYHIKPLSAVLPLYHPVVKEALVLEALASLEGKELLFMAEKEVRITITNGIDGISTIRYLRKGEVMFMTYYGTLKLTADHPENVDVFLGGKKEILLGKMQEFFG